MALQLLKNFGYLSTSFLSTKFLMKNVYCKRKDYEDLLIMLFSRFHVSYYHITGPLRLKIDYNISKYPPYKLSDMLHYYIGGYSSESTYDFM